MGIDCKNIPEDVHFCSKCGRKMERIKCFLSGYDEGTGSPWWWSVYACPEKTKGFFKMLFGGHGTATGVFREWSKGSPPDPCVKFN